MNEKTQTRHNHSMNDSHYNADDIIILNGKLYESSTFEFSCEDKLKHRFPIELYPELRERMRIPDPVFFYNFKITFQCLPDKNILLEIIKLNSRNQISKLTYIRGKFQYNFNEVKIYEISGDSDTGIIYVKFRGGLNDIIRHK